MSGPPEDRPDGLLCTSQNLSDSIVAGLFAANTRVPEDVEIVTNCLLPTANGSLIPMQRLGFAVQDYLETFIRLTAEQMQGEFPPMTLVDPTLE